MLELNINAKTPSAINGAVKKIKEMTQDGAIKRDTPIRLVLDAGIYRETVKYNLPNPLIIESAHGIKNSECILMADNCESYNSGLINRGIFVFGPNVSNVTLKNFTIENTHVKSLQDFISPLDSAEALIWNNTSGTLFCEGMKIISRQNTLCLKGYSFFLNSFISGDVNFIYGEADTAYFENCEIFAREDNRGDFDAYVVNSQALADKTGFIFFRCRFTADKRKKASVYVYRTDGKGSSTSDKDWDSIALVDCMISELYAPELLWDDDMNLEVYPRGNSKVGLREYNSKTVLKNGSVEEADTSRRNVKSYTLTDEDYFNGYASRYLMLRETPFYN